MKDEYKEKCYCGNKKAHSKACKNKRRVDRSRYLRRMRLKLYNGSK